MKTWWKRPVCCASALGLLFAAGVSVAQPATPVPQLDLDRLRGSWYEVARLPVKSEKGCRANVSQLIAFGSGKSSLQFVEACDSRYGGTDTSGMNATQDKSRDGKLKVKHLLIFSRHYWVLALAQDDSWMLIGRPNHKQLWVLSKTMTLPPDVMTQIKAKADADGFDSSKLVMTLQEATPTV